jgi:hypothetical protein
MTWRFLAAGAVLGVVAFACSSDRVDRDDAVAQVLAEAGGRIGQEQAECYVDRVLDEIGPAPLRPDAELSPSQEARLTTIRVDCIGVANLGAGAPEDTTVPTTSPGGVLPGPRARGDSAELDALWDACAAGWGQACDDLFAQAPLGSAYESFGASCGARTREPQCAAVYPSPGVTLPSPAQATTTVPPPMP